jgi:hypothetical protein
LERYSPARTFHLLAEQSFNYDIQGARGFEAVAALINPARCYQFTYSDLNEARASFDALALECLDG